jgi:transcriptional regulator with XRE-family HTH domain
MTSTIATKAHKRLITLLIEARERAGLRQAQVAKLLGRSQTWIARVEGGRRRIDVVEFYRMAKLFRIDPKRLVGRIWRLLGREGV